MVGVLGVHSENSIKKCALSIQDICKTAASNGYAAVALTDYGTMTGVVEFVKTADQFGIKPVPGVELCVSKGEQVFTLVLLAKDHVGYVGISKAVSEANHCLIDGVPILPIEKLESFFGKNSIYHEHVFALSSGLSGELLQTASADASIAQEIVRSKKEYEETIVREVSELITQEDSILREIRELDKEKIESDKKANRVFIKKEERVERLRLENVEEYKSEFQKLEKEKTECEQAKKKSQSLAGKINRKKNKLKMIRKEIKTSEQDKMKKEQLLEKISKLKDSRIDVEETTIQCAREYQNIFGEHFYIELMFHGYEQEVVAADRLSKAASVLSIKTVVSNDVYMTGNTEEDLLKWQIIQSLKDNEWVEMDFQKGEFWMKDSERLKSFLEGLYDEDILDKSFVYMEELFDQCCFEWPKEDHYPKYEDPQGRDSCDVLEELVRANIPKLYKQKEWTEEHETRLKYELSVIKKTGYSDYTLILSEILKEGRDIYHDGEVSYYIGPGRGSGAGSLVNYLARITNIDPIRYGLIFERYLNIERVSPPDIDSDIATSIRDALVDWIIKRFNKQEGKIGVCSITTKSRLTAKAAVRAAGRVVSARMFGNAASLYSVADLISKAIPSDPHVQLSDHMDELSELFQDDLQQEILYYARLIEGCLSAYGTHAAGIIISDSGDVTDYAPVMNMGTNENPVWNIQCDMVESESIGLLKLDALGLTTLDVNTNTIKRIYRTTGKKIDLDRIPFEKQVFKEIYSKGNTNGVFQCDSAGMKKMWKELQPDSIDDIIAGISLFRPGPMDYIPDYIKGKRNPEKIKYITPELIPILKSTYGCIVYQGATCSQLKRLSKF